METGLLFMLVLCGFCVGANGRCSPSSDSAWQACPPGWSWFGVHCYWFEKSEKDWADAERFCNSFDGNLASIQSQAEYSFLRDLIFREAGQHKPSWVGGHDGVKEGVWMWSDGSRFTFSAWGKDEPNNQGGSENCMEVNLRGEDFVNDGTCTLKQSFVCMKDP